MNESFVETPEVQTLLDRASGMNEAGGDQRLKTITRDLIGSLMTLIVRHDISESEVWNAVNFLQAGAGEFGLLMPGSGLDHFIDLYLDAKDAEAGLTGGTPRTIEGPLYVEGAPLVENDADLTSDPDDTGTLYMSGTVTGPDGKAVRLIEQPSDAFPLFTDTQAFVETAQASETLKARARQMRDEFVQALAAVLADEADRSADDSGAFLAAGLITATWSMAFVRAHAELSRTGDAAAAQRIFLGMIDRGVAGTHAALAGTAFGDA